MVLNPKIVPLKGKPDFTRFSDERLEACLEHVQGLIHAYEAFSEEREVLYKIWKALSDHQIDRESFGGYGKEIKTDVGVNVKPFRVSMMKPKTRLFIK